MSLLRLPRERTWVLDERPAVLGILNVTPDSFSDGGLYWHEESSGGGVEAIVQAAMQMIADGADAIDVGGESTRPGAEDVSASEQIRRVVPVIRALRAASDIPISIDTRQPRVGEAALEAGADIINDVSALEGGDWLPVLRHVPVPVILMHMRGTPRDMAKRTEYDRGVVTEVVEYLGRRLADLEAAGLARDRFLVDPGIGFAKTSEQNLEILAELDRLTELGRPVLIGASRKRFLKAVLRRGIGARDDADARASRSDDRDIGTLAVHAIAALRGASVLRVHNVAWACDLADVIAAVRRAGRPSSS